MSHFKLDRQERAVLITLDTPPYNTIDADVMEEGTALLTALSQEGQATAVVLTGSGSAFCRGMNTKTAFELDAQGQVRTRRAIDEFCAALHRLPGAVVSAVNGHSIGAGGIMLLCSDWVVAAEGDYKIGVPEAKAGLAFPKVPQAILDHWLDPVWRRRLVLTSQLRGPHDAMAPGLVDEVVNPDALIETALNRAAQMHSQAAFADCKRQMRAKAQTEIDALIAK